MKLTIASLEPAKLLVRSMPSAPTEDGPSLVRGYSVDFSFVHANIPGTPIVNKLEDLYSLL